MELQASGLDISRCRFSKKHSYLLAACGWSLQLLFTKHKYKPIVYLPTQIVNEQAVLVINLEIECNTSLFTWM